MTDDIQGALQRLELLLESKGTDTVLDEASGFTTNDAQLLLGELRLAQSKIPADGEPDEMLEGPVGLL